MAELATHLGQICGELPAWQETRDAVEQCKLPARGENEPPSLFQLTQDEAAAKKAAVEAIELLARHRYTDARLRFAVRLSEALPGRQLNSLWEDLTDDDGSFKAVTGAAMREGLVRVSCAFQKRSRDFEVAVDSSLRIAEVSVPPAHEGIEWTVDPASPAN